MLNLIYSPSGRTSTWITKSMCLDHLLRLCGFRRGRVLSLGAAKLFLISPTTGSKCARSSLVAAAALCLIEVFPHNCLVITFSYLGFCTTFPGAVNVDFQGRILNWPYFGIMAF